MSESEKVSARARAAVRSCDEALAKINEELNKPRPRPLTPEECGRMFRCKKHPERRAMQILEDGNVIQLRLPRRH